MSQAGIVDFEGSHPQVPTTFVTNMGTAVPIGNTLEILGTIVAAHSIPLETTGSGNTVTIVTQYSSAAGSSVGTNAGLSSFSSTYFTVDANGFVTLNGSAIGETITGNTGGALAPTAGNWNILGISTAAGTTPVQTAGSGSTLIVQVQKSQAIASTNATNVGLAAFNSAFFTVDANGFVSINGSAIGETITGNTGGPLNPDGSNNFNILTANSTVKFAGSGSTLTQDFGLTNLLIGNAGAAITSATNNIGIGLLALSALSTGVFNVAIGENSLLAVSTGGSNIAIGISALRNCTSSNNCAIGVSALTTNVGGGGNVAIGYQVLKNATTSSYNTCFGYQAGLNYTTTESHNILIGEGTGGTIGESNVTRIGSAQNKCYIDGIDDVNVGSVAKVVTEANDQLGTAIITGGTGVTITPSANVITISVAGTGSLMAQVTLTSAQVKNLLASPVELVAAPGVTKLILPSFLFVELIYGGTNPFISSSSTFEILYNITSMGINNNFVLLVTSSDNNLQFYNNFSSGGIFLKSDVINQPIMIGNLGSTDFSGNAADDNQVKVTLYYTILTY